MSKLLLSISLLLVAVATVGQTINVELKNKPNAQLALVLMKGEVSDTIANTTLDSDGKAQIIIPESYKNYRGIGTLRSIDVKIDIVIAGENMNVSSEGERSEGRKVNFENSLENSALKSYFARLQQVKQVIPVLTGLFKAYGEKDPFRISLEKEVHRLVNDEYNLDEEASKSPLYSARFFEIYKFLVENVSPLPESSDTTQYAYVKKYFRDKIDMDALYTSGLWAPVVNGSLNLYFNHKPYTKDLLASTIKILERIKNQETFDCFAETVLKLYRNTERYDEERYLMYWLVNSGRIQEASILNKTLLPILKLVKDSDAPALSQGEMPKGKVLLMFYESGCNSCTEEIADAITLYPQFKTNGFEVVSISADSSEQIFKNTAADFPWKFQYRDSQGFAGTDFRNYGIIGTPTFFLINQSGKVIGRYSRIEEVVTIMKSPIN